MGRWRRQSRPSCLGSDEREPRLPWVTHTSSLHVSGLLWAEDRSSLTESGRCFHPGNLLTAGGGGRKQVEEESGTIHSVKKRSEREADVWE